MNEILLNILSIVVMAVILPLVSYGISRLIAYLNTKVKDEKTKVYLSQATEVVNNVVRMVFQTYVDTLKKNASFDESAQLEALNKAKEKIMSLLNKEVIEFINKNYGDINNWITTQIESTINVLKNSK